MLLDFSREYESLGHSHQEGVLKSGTHERTKHSRQLSVPMRMLLLLLGAVAIIVIMGLCIGGITAKKEAEKAAEEAARLAAEVTAQQAAEQTATEQVRVEQAMLELPDVDVEAWELQLVRYENQLGENFAPELADIENDQQFDARAAAHLKALIQAARDAGYTIYFCSGYRDYETQSIIYWNHINDFMEAGMTADEAHAETRLSVNYPGASEHQLGLAADLLEFKEQEMESWIGGSGLMLWLEENCADYGFVIRYPENKTDVTGVSYEPWHLRYVGGEAARYMMDNGLCLEEFLALYE